MEKARANVGATNKTSEKLKSVKTKQYSLSFEHMITPSTKASISAYKKEYYESTLHIIR